MTDPERSAPETPATEPTQAAQAPTLPTPSEQAFPTLTAEQVGRIRAVGTVHAVERGHLLIDVGEQRASFFVVVSGRVAIVRPSLSGEDLIAVHGPGHFIGEINTLSGRRALVRARVDEAGEMIELDRDQLLALVQTDSELGEILLRAFILRRVELIAHGQGDAVLIGSDHSAGTLQVKEFLARNGHPYAYLDLDRDDAVQEILDRFHIGLEDVPVLICRGDTVLRNPTPERIADCLGFNEAIDPAQVHDLVIIGAGPSGLAAAVYGASEGLDVLVLEAGAPGGQAGSSSKIENYLGFPTGISGQDLAARAFTQAQKFGAQLMVAKGAKRLGCERKPYAIEIEDGPKIQARTVILATGAEYRRLALTNLAKFEGAGIYYGATYIEAQLCGGDEVIVVGGGNSAGQAAVYLAQTARRVHLMVRADGLAESMSRYLIRRIEGSANIRLTTRTELDALEGETHLERVRWKNRDSGATESHNIRHIFVMTGAAPCTAWLAGCVALDAKGFIKTGSDLSPEDLAAWPLGRPPHLLETSLPGVFAVGDVRAGNVKRVASAVGEGSIAVSFVHRVLHE